MRIVTRPDFDGIVCAVLLTEALDIDQPVKWTEPNAVQNGLIEILPKDVIANLSYNENCSLWFDHHVSNKIDKPFAGAYALAPSTARLIFEYFKDRFQRDYSRLVEQTDEIDSANLTLDEVLYPEKYAHISLDMTIASHKHEDTPYWNRLVDLLKSHEIEALLKDAEVRERIAKAVAENELYREYLEKHTVMRGSISVTDFRSFQKTPFGNRFLVFSLFPRSTVNVKIRNDEHLEDKVVVSIGHSIFDKSCRVSAGEICRHFRGGGHRGAGSCCFSKNQAAENIAFILDNLEKNEDITFPG